MPARQFNSQDEAHLKLISVLHFVLGGLYLLGIGFLVIHFTIMSFVIRHAESESRKPAAHSASVGPVTPTFETQGEEVAPPETGIATAPAPVPVPSAAFPKEIIPVFIAFYVIFGVFLVALCVCNVLSGLYVRKRKNRIFSFVVAGVNCMQFPFGTALGVFTFIVLSRVSVKMDYDSRLPA